MSPIGAIARTFYRQFASHPPVPTASFASKTVIVTGANVGLGLEAARHVVRLGAALVILACRNTDKGEAAAKDIRASTSCSPETLQVWKLDLASFQSVLAFAERVEKELERVDVLIANAGLSTNKFKLSQEGYEETLTTNVISCFLHVFLLYPKLHATAVKHDTLSHITVVSSDLYEIASFKERKLAKEGELFKVMSDQAKAAMWDRYAVSKLLQILLVREMAAMVPVEKGKVVINSVTPGFCRTSLLRELDSAFMRGYMKVVARSAEMGARNLVYAASMGLEGHGQYTVDCKVEKMAALVAGKDGEQLQKRVWGELKTVLEGVKKGVIEIA